MTDVNVYIMSTDDMTTINNINITKPRGPKLIICDYGLGPCVEQTIIEDPIYLQWAQCLRYDFSVYIKIYSCYDNQLLNYFLLIVRRYHNSRRQYDCMYCSISLSGIIIHNNSIFSYIYTSMMATD